MTDTSPKRPTEVIKLAERRLNEGPLGTLRQSHLDRVNYFVQDIMKLQKWRLDIDTKSRPKTITIVPLDDQGCMLSVRFKMEREMLEKLNGFLYLPEYVVRFWKRNP